LAEVLGSPDVIVTAAAAAAAADVFAVATSNGGVFLFDRCGFPPRPRRTPLCSCAAPSPSPHSEPFFRSDSLVFLHAFHDLDSAVSGIVLSRDGCDMRVTACAALLFSRAVLSVSPGVHEQRPRVFPALEGGGSGSQGRSPSPAAYRPQRYVETCCALKRVVQAKKRDSSSCEK
jgi:hypothetical protein